MQVDWIKHIKDETERKKFVALLKNSDDVLHRLITILKGRINLIPSVTDYNNPSWPYFQADQNGYNRALTEVIKLLEVNPDHDH